MSKEPRWMIDELVAQMIDLLVTQLPEGFERDLTPEARLVLDAWARYRTTGVVAGPAETGT